MKIDLFMITILFLLLGSSWGEEQASSEIITQIERAQPIIDDTIYGDLVFGNISVKSPIYITNCTFVGAVDFRGARFEKPLFLVNNKFKGKLFANNLTQFNGDILFDDSEFYDIINFRETLVKNMQCRGVKFAGDVIFWNCRFIGRSDFRDAIFLGDADFERCAFNGQTGFSGCKFKKDAHFQNIESSRINRITFSDSVFSGDADFSNAHLYNSSANDCTFEKSAIFSGVEFERVSYFRRTEFGGLADFERCKFFNDTTFTEAAFNKSASFSNANFFNNADFSRSRFAEKADFLKASFHGNSTFNEAQFNGDLSFEGVTFLGCLALSKTKFNKIYVRWNDIRDNLEYDDAAYMALQENFKKLGLIDDLDGCYYRYRSSHRQQNWTSTIQTGMLGYLDEKFRKFIDFLLDILYKYGVDPLRPFIISLILILSSAFLWWIIGIGEIVDINGENIIKNGFWSEVVSLREPIIFSFLIFLSAAKFFIDTPIVKIPQPIERTYSWSKYILYFERAFAGILLALLFIAISRTIVRNA